MAYTEGSLLAFMETEIAGLLTVLGLDASDALTEAVAEVVAILGTPIADVDDDLKLRTVARWQAWQAALNAAMGQYDLKAGSADLKRSQVVAHLETRLAQAERSAMRYDEVAAVLAGTSTAYISSMSTASNPYAWSFTSTEWG